jgi:3-oxoacyl-[acyl-carrier protein] reductase
MEKMMFDLKGKTALVTGGSRSLGAGICECLGKAGANVAINYVTNDSAADKVVAKISASGGTAAKFKANVTSEEDVKRLVADVKERFGSVDIVVVNATCLQEKKPIEEQTWEDYEGMIDFFIKSPFLLMKTLVGEMKTKGYGRFINICSEVFELGDSEYAHYVAAKGAQLGMTRSWARELAEFGVTVNAVSPGWIPVERTADWPQQLFDQYAAGVPMKRQGVPADIGSTVTFLASDEANFITGQNLSVNGGNTLT